MDFYRICTKEIEKGPNAGFVEVYPDFRVGRSKDLMIRGSRFYAIWDEAAGLWSTDEYDVQRLVDEELDAYAKKLEAQGQGVIVKHLKSFNTHGWSQFRKFMMNVSDNSKQLDSTLTFRNTEVTKSDYVSRRLPYDLTSGDYSAWDEIVGTLYSVEERAKIEWIIGAIVSGDSKRIQKFLVLYGPGGTGKSTILNIIEKLFVGYTTTFEAKALGSNGGSFATEVFKNNPLVAIQQDGDLSKIEDNSRLNSIISHDYMTMNEKYKSSYTARIEAILLMATNQPVKISDAKSGIIRRLIDVTPTGVTIPPKHYHALMQKIDFELGAIASHCLDVYHRMGKNYYNGYRPTEMMLQTDVFFNFIEAHYDIFKSQNMVTLKQGYSLYKEWANDTGIERLLPQYKVREELRNYFDEFKDRAVVDDVVVRSIYSGFNANKFKQQDQNDHTFSLVMDETVSLLDQELADCPAQTFWLNEDGIEQPRQPWKYVETKLSDLDTTELHYVKVPKQMIMIDFDLPDSNGHKSLERNLEAAASDIWPATYAELSKSGNGVHLVYYYDGDVRELAVKFSEGIEVKTLLGDASMRRKLTKCNNVPIATINSGLPLKEKKPMLTESTIKSEQALRAQIEKNFEKKIHPSTASSISFIKKILDDAYDSGLDYDVTDLKHRLVVFANNSTNQSMSCIKTVQKMRLKGMDVPVHLRPQDEAKGDSYDNQEIAFYDVEVYPNLLHISWKYRGSKTKVHMINPKPHEVEQLFKLKLVGFYNRRYDNHILWAASLGFSNQKLFELSQKIVEDHDNNVMFGQAYNISYADVWDFASEKMSLKKWQIKLGLKHQEMDLPWDQPVPEELWPKVAEYCDNDLDSTEAVFEARYQDFVARQILADLSGLSVNDTTQKHTAKILFGSDRTASEYFVYTDLRRDFPGYEFERGVSTYRDEVVGEGGYVYAEPGVYESVVLLDIASMHPTSIEQLNYFGPYTAKFTALKAARLAIKRGDFDEARTMLDGRLAPYLSNPEDADALSDALKIVINIVYGLTSAKFDNPFRNIKNVDNIVAKRGALFMIDLKHAVQEQGFTVAHIKTDSIKIPNATDEIIKFIEEYGEKWGYEFEHEATYDKFCLVNDAVYIARYGWAKKKHLIGLWGAVGAQFQHPYVFKTLFSHADLELGDYFEHKSVSKGLMYIDYEFDRPVALTDAMHFVGKTGSFIPVKENGGFLYRYQNEKFYHVSGTKGYQWIEAEMYRSTPDAFEIDMSYYEDLCHQAIKTIDKYGSFDEFVK